MNSSDYLNLPAGKPPPGVTPNFDHPQSRAVEQYVGVGICLGFALIFVLLRLYVKLAIRRWWGWDDWACLLGFGLITAYVGVVISLTDLSGKHQWDLKLSSFTKSYYKRLLSKTSLFCASAFFVKLSLFLLYLRLFKPDKVTRWLVYGGIFVSGLFYLSTTISGVVISIPSHGHLDNDAVWLAHFIQQGHKLEILAITLSVFGVFSDIYLLVIPIRSIFQLQLPIHRKFGISSIFLIGILAILCSIGGFYLRIKLLDVSDVQWFSVPLWIFSVAEICAGIICSCMPILKALFSDRARHKSPFASLTAFLSRFNLRGIRQPLMSEQSTSFDKLSSDPVDSHLDGKRDDSIKLKSGIESTNLNEAV